MTGGPGETLAEKEAKRQGEKHIWFDTEKVEVKGQGYTAVIRRCAAVPVILQGVEDGTTLFPWLILVVQQRFVHSRWRGARMLAEIVNGSSHVY